MAKNVGKLLREQVKQRRSPLYVWLKDNYDEIAPVIAQQARPSWEALARTARDSGQKGPVDGGPSRQTVRKAWFRLLEDMTREAAEAVKPSKKAVASIPPPVHAPAPPPARALVAEADPDQDEAPMIREPRHKFGGVPASNRVKPKPETI